MTRKYPAGEESERQSHWLTGGDMPGINLMNLDADPRLGRFDKCMTAATGNAATRAPFRSAAFVTKPLDGARTMVLSRFHFAASSCARN